MGNNSDFQKVLDKCLELDEEWRDVEKPEGFKLGYHSQEDSMVTLYNVLTTKKNLERLRQELNNVGVLRYRIVVHEPHEERSNVHILDIGV